MTRVAISVEGRTEEEFVKKILADHLQKNGVEMTPILLGYDSRRVPSLRQLGNDIRVTEVR